VKRKTPASLSLQVGVITFSRLIFSIIYRMMYPFLTTFQRGLGVDLSAITLAITSESLAGVMGPILAPIADRRGRKISMLLGMLVFVFGVGLVVVSPGYPTFFAALVLSATGSQIFIPAAQAYLSDQVPYEKRGRVIGITELSWALAFILGVPAMGILIEKGILPPLNNLKDANWAAPFPVLLLAGLFVLVLIFWFIPSDRPAHKVTGNILANYRQVLTSPAALAGLALGFAISLANENVNMMFGVWLEDSFGLQLAALGTASAVIGLSELGGSGLSAWLVDRFGKERSIRLGLILNCVAAIFIFFFGGQLWGAFIGLALFYLTFEFLLVSSLPLITEILPSSVRATMIALNLALISLGRAAGAQIAPQLYKSGFLTNVIAAIGLNLLAILILGWVKPQPQPSATLTEPQE
jgi:predicted MFS family arabinose efflux permease